MRLQLRWQHQFQFAGYYMALEKGYYRDAGLSVAIAEGGPRIPHPIDEVLSGRAEFAIANSGLIIQRLAGKPVVALAAIMQTSPLVWLVRGDSKIFVPHDLIGKRVMMRTSPQSTELMTMLRQEGLDAAQMTILPNSSRLDDLIEGRVDAYDAYISNEPYSLRQKGIAFRTINPREYGVNFYSDILMTREDLVRSDPEMIKAFTQASLRGWEYALAHREETVQLIHRKYAPDKEIDHLRFEAETLQKLIVPDLVQLGHMNPGRWEYIANSYIQNGMARGPVDLEGFMFTDGGDKAYRLAYRIGWISLLALVAFGAVTLRFATLSRALKREMRRRRKIEQELRNSNLALQKQATIDPLTGLWNRLRFEEFAATEIGRANRYAFGLALLMFDIDHFKRINDAHGHQTGDSVLAGVSRLVSEHLRESDGIGRWGGEEFLILAPCANIGEAAILAEKLRELIAAEKFPESINVTASFGVTLLRKGESLAHLVKRADAALYQAKASGRNRVEIAGEDNKHERSTELAHIPVIRLVWNEAFAFGIPVLDNEHRTLFDLSNAAIHAIESQQPDEIILAALKRLVDELAEHCGNEEKEMTDDGYPGHEQHSAEHRQLLAQATQMLNNWRSGEFALGNLVNFMAREVIARHIMTTDRTYANYRLDAAA